MAQIATRRRWCRRRQTFVLSFASHRHSTTGGVVRIRRRTNLEVVSFMLRHEVGDEGPVELSPVSGMTRRLQHHQRRVVSWLHLGWSQQGGCIDDGWNLLFRTTDQLDDRIHTRLVHSELLIRILRDRHQLRKQIHHTGTLSVTELPFKE